MTDELDADAARTRLARVLHSDDDIETKIEAALDLGRRYLGVDNGYLARIDTETDYFHAPVTTDPPDGKYPPGATFDLQRTFCRHTIREDESVRFHDAASGGYADDDAHEATDVACYHGTPIRVDGAAFGTVCFISSTPRDEPFSDEETLVAEFVARTIERLLERRRFRAEIDRLDEFASVVSHDLRNPLNVAQARVEFAAERPEEAAEHLDTAANALDRIEALIDSSLTVARQGGEVADPDRVSLARMAEGGWSTVATADATLAVTDDCEFMADRDRLRHVFENLYRNAVEHAGPDVTVTVGSLDDGFYVADDGPGIPADERGAVFEAGYSDGSDHGGQGFGLAIVESVVDAHDWSVSVTDAPADEGGGTRFEFHDVVVRDD